MLEKTFYILLGAYSVWWLWGALEWVYEHTLAGVIL